MNNTMEFAPIETTDKRVTTWILGIGEVLGVRHYMSLERLYQAAFDQNMRCGGTKVALEPDLFDPFMDGEWQLMTEEEYEQLINFSTEQLMLHRTAESNLREIDTAPLTFCMNGCLHDCTQLVGERGQLLPPALFRVYYLRAGGDLAKIVVSCKPSVPAGDGYCHHGSSFRRPKSQPGCTSPMGVEARPPTTFQSAAHRRWTYAEVARRAGVL